VDVDALASARPSPPFRPGRKRCGDEIIFILLDLVIDFQMVDAEKAQASDFVGFFWCWTRGGGNTMYFAPPC
jgi:hypothetical protein